MLKPIKLNEPNRFRDDFPSLSFQVDDKHAISTDGCYIQLFGIVEDPNEPGAYIRAWNDTLFVAIDDERTIAGLERVVQALKQMDAFTLLTKHFNFQMDTFFINRDREFAMSYEEGEQHPAINPNTKPMTGNDY